MQVKNKRLKGKNTFVHFKNITKHNDNNDKLYLKRILKPFYLSVRWEWIIPLDHYLTCSLKRMAAKQYISKAVLPDCLAVLLFDVVNLNST